MKTTKQLAIFAAILICSYTSHAITNTVIAVSGTNIVLSWPSFGYESYLVQYRQTLDPSDSWSVLTNAYHANSTNRTTLTLYGAVTGSGGSGGFTAMAANESSFDSTAVGPLVVPLDGSSDGVPLALYPPGFDLSNFNIFDPLSGESVSGANYVVSPVSQQTGLSLDSLDPSLDPSGDPQPNGGSGGSPAPTTGFFRVFHIPNWLSNFSGYIFDGPTFIPVDYSPPDADLDHVDSTTVLIGGQPNDYAQFMLYTNSVMTNWGVGIYFDLLPNGTNTIQLLTTVRQSDVIDGTPYMVFSNAPTAITIGNLITFTNCDDFIWNGTNYTFNAQTVANVDWEIDIYDWNGNFVNFQTGHSNDGNISWTWNLYDYLGNLRNNFDSDFAFFPYFTITGNLPSSAQNGGMEPNANGSASRWGKTAAGLASSIGNWVVAYEDTFYTDGVTNTEGDNMAYSAGISSIVSEPQYQWEIPTVQHPLKFGRTYTQAQRNDSWRTLKSYLSYPTFRNFYYFGHGATNGIGGDMNIVVTNTIIGGTNFPGSRANIPEWYIRQSIAYNASSGSHPYRFVYLDCCDAGAGGCSDAFGIPKEANGMAWYSSPSNTRHIRPNAFVGWDSIIHAGPADKYWQYRSTWIFRWSRGGTDVDLLQALDNARDTSGWWSVPDITQHRKIYGASDMTFRQ